MGTMGTNDLDLQAGLLLWQYDSDFSLHRHPDKDPTVHLGLLDVKYSVMKTSAVGQKMTHQTTVDNFLIKKKSTIFNVYIFEQLNVSSA